MLFNALINLSWRVVFRGAQDEPIQPDEGNNECCADNEFGSMLNDECFYIHFVLFLCLLSQNYIFPAKHDIPFCTKTLPSVQKTLHLVQIITLYNLQCREKGVSLQRK